jgi:hypothetical protein
VTILILIGARFGHLIDRLFHRDMAHTSALIRYQAILKFQRLWRFRSQIRMRLETGAQAIIKVTHTHTHDDYVRDRSTILDTSAESGICFAIAVTWPS